MIGVSTFDKYIKMSWQMVLMDVVLGYVGIIMVAGTPELMGTCALIFLILPVAAIIDTARKVFFKSLYGSDAVTYQSLPVSSEEMVLAKVSVVTGVSLLMIAALLAAVMFTALYMSRETFPDFVAMLTGQEYLNEFHIPYIAAAEIAGAVTGHFRMWTVIFAAVVWYNSRPDGQKNALMKLVAGAGALLLECAIGLPTLALTRMSGEDYWLPARAMAIVINIIAAVVLYKYTVRRLSSHYELS